MSSSQDFDPTQGAPSPQPPYQPPAQPPYAAYPGYSGPTAYPPAPNTGVGGLAIAALIVSIVAFLSGWVPFVGLILAIVGIVLGILAVRGARGKGFGITALVLSGLAALTGIFMLVLTFMILPAAIEGDVQRYGESTELWTEDGE